MSGGIQDRAYDGREANLKQYIAQLSGKPAYLDALPTASRFVVAANPRFQWMCS